MPRTDAITLFIPGPLRDRCGGARRIEVESTTVREALEEIERRHPALFLGICDETGAVRRHIGVFVNSDHIRDRDGLDTPLVAGDAVSIMPAVSGG
jgi:MoaD family protein